MDGECQKLAGNKNSVRFDFRMKRIAIAHWLAFGKTGLNSLRENSLEIIPSLRTVEREFSYFRAGESEHCPSKCALFHDVLAAAQRLTDKKVPVQILFDEIKLRSGVWYNCNTKVVHGFAASKNGTTISFAEEILSMASDYISDSDSPSPEEANPSSPDNDSTSPDKDKSSNYNGAATHANVFRARTTQNETWNLAYFLNCGSLDGDELVRQILLVTTCCELVGLLVQCLISDAGGGNAGALRLLTGGKCSKLKTGIPFKESFSFVNPLSPEQNIFIIFCAVHALKAFRNQLWSSREKGTRFLTIFGSRIEWQRIVDLYHKFNSENKAESNVHQARFIKYSVAYPDSWSKMNVHDAKVPFAEQTLDHQCHWLAQKMR